MIKKITAVLASLLLVALLFAGCSSAQIKNIISLEIDTYDPATETVADMLGKEISEKGLENGDFTYCLLNDGTAVITAYKGKSTVLNIPEQIDSHTVVGIENKTFYESKITELIFPDTLEAVGNFAAMYCTELEKVTFGENIKIIGVSAFESRGNNSNETGSGKLKEIVFKNAPETIRQKAFQFADKLEEIVIPNGVKTIENWAFAKCYSANKIIIGDGLEFIGDHAFLKCKNAKEVVIPGSCKTIEASAFYQCIGIEKLTLANGIETIGKGAFEECSSLKSVTIPESVKTIEKYVFYNCTALEECEISNPETIANDVFTNDKNVKIITTDGSSADEYANANNIKSEIKHY